MNASFISSEGLGISKIDHETDPNLWISVAWPITEKQAESMIEMKIYFHASQDKASYFGGVVVGFRPTLPAEGDTSTYAIIFKADDSCRGALPSNLSSNPWVGNVRLF